MAGAGNNHADLVTRVLSGDSTAVARAISRVERGGSSAREMIRAVFANSGRAQIVGVTGAPGTGKSTLVNELAKEFQRRGRRVGIIAIDPSSPFTGGAILGDRLRMQDLTGTGIFIRSMATRGYLGGLAAAAAGAVTVLDAAGFDMVFVETVGAGQNEVDIARNAHTTMVLEAPGLGDDIQAIKAGILEIADLLVVNKADRDGVESTVAALEMNPSLNRNHSNWRPPVYKTVALTGQGVPDVANAVERHWEYLEREGLRAAREQARLRDELTNLLQKELLQLALASMTPERLEEVTARIVTRELDPYTAAEEILSTLSV